MDVTSQVYGIREVSARERTHVPRLAVALRVAGWAAWLLMVAWKLTSVPGMHMDEAWYILSTRGQWPPDNPLSGLTSYAGPFPLLLLKIFGAGSGLLVLRGASLLANGVMLVLLARMLGYLYPWRVRSGWAVPLLATTPVWVLMMRTGFDVTMFTPVLSILGLYLLLSGRTWAAFGAGVSWGFLVYNHLLGAYFPISLGIGWLVVYRRLPRIAWGPALAGFALGLAPRVAAIALYGKALDPSSSAGKYSFDTAVADLKELPSALWDTLHGAPAYVTFAGYLARDVWPYWSLALLLLLPWLTRLRSIPRHAWWTLIASLLFSVLATVGSPYMAVRFFILPAVGLAFFWVQLGASALALGTRWAYVVRPVAAALILCNCFYLLSNFYVPWEKRDLSISFYRFGARSPLTSTWGYLPQDELVRKLLELEPPPEQVLANAPLDRPLRVLLADTPIRVVSWEEADKALRTVFIDYNYNPIQSRMCLPVANGTLCLRKPLLVDEHFVLYR